MARLLRALARPDLWDLKLSKINLYFLFCKPPCISSLTMCRQTDLFCSSNKGFYILNMNYSELKKNQSVSVIHKYLLNISLVIDAF